MEALSSSLHVPMSPTPRARLEEWSEVSGGKVRGAGGARGRVRGEVRGRGGRGEAERAAMRGLKRGGGVVKVAARQGRGEVRGRERRGKRAAVSACNMLALAICSSTGSPLVVPALFVGPDLFPHFSHSLA